MFLKNIQKSFAFMLKKIDLFPTTQFLRSNTQPQHTTIAGGFLSLMILTLIIILFYNKGIQIMNRQIINSSLSSQIETDPSFISVTTSPAGGFMFALTFLGINLNDPSITYFDISLTQDYWSPIYKVINTTNVPLVQCTLSHFDFNDQIKRIYHTTNLQRALCPPINYQFSVGGRVTSQILAQFNIVIKKCNNATNTNCASDDDMDSLFQNFGGYTVAIPLVNTIVNPDDQDYKLVYLQDRNYFTFNPFTGVQINAEIAQFEVNTDMSILPISYIVNDLISTVPSLLTSKNRQINNDVFVKIHFGKSSTSNTYTRSFNKIDDFASYIGGLISSLLTLFFIFNFYSQRSYLVDVAAALISTQDSQISLKNFNLFYNIGVTLKRILDFFQIGFNWKRGDLLIQSMDEIEHQLDICFLMQKISFLQSAISSLLTEHQIDVLCLKDKTSLQDLKRWRKKSKLSQVLSNAWTLNNQGISEKDLESISQSRCDGPTNENYKEQFNKIKESVEKVLQQSKNNNLISERISKKIDPIVFQKLGMIQVLSIREMKDLKQLKQFSNQQLQVGEVTSSNLVKNSKNAVANQSQDHRYSNQNDLIMEEMT